MNETLFAIYFPIWLALAIGTFLFFRGREPAFKKRWHRPVYGLNVAVIGGMLVAMTIPNWTAFAIFTVAFMYFMWVGIFQTRVCLGCGRICQPTNLITPEKFCSKCGTALA
ncbi:MAG: hypothetical protein JRH14_19205 [Deltaproteobacteria bacterium]|nr:hypothetical protein [Deltaproteobacteria bacterium]